MKTFILLKQRLTLNSGLRSIILILSIAFLSITQQSNAFVSVQSVTESNPPSMACTNTELVIAGQLGAANYAYSGINFTVTGFNITINIEYISGIVVLPAITPFSETANIGMLPAGTYNVTTNGVLSGVISSTFTSTLVINSCCSAVGSFIANTDTVCLGDSLLLTNTSTGSLSHFWYKDNVPIGTMQDVAEEMNTPGTYTYKLIVNAATCSDSVSQTIVVIDYPNIELGNDTTICGGFFLILGVGTGWDQINWSTGSTASSIAINFDGTYSIMVDLAGCVTYDTIDVLFLPNSTAIDTQTACSEYMWIDGNTYTSDNNTATYTIPNSVGCDSIITLNLTLGSLNATIYQSVDSLIVAQSATSYQWLDCDNGYAQISGATNQYYIPASNGNYAVEVIDGPCLDTSSCFHIQNVGIEDVFGSAFNLYPNPSNGRSELQLDKIYNQLQVHLYDLSGKTLESRFIQNVSKVILEYDFAPGSYLVKVISGKNQVVLPLIIE